MVKSEGATAPEEALEEAPPKKAAEAEAAPTSVNPRSKNRKDLLYAMKPYLSEKRARAIDSMISIAEVFTILKR